MTSAKKTILVVEDEYSIRKTLQEALELAGFDVLTAVNGKEGLAKLKGSPRPSLVLLDMMMPVMGGREFMNHVAQDEALSSIPLLVVSATAELPDTAGAKAFIKKPVDLDVLLKLVEEHSKSVSEAQ